MQVWGKEKTFSRFSPLEWNIPAHSLKLKFVQGKFCQVSSPMDLEISLNPRWFLCMQYGNCHDVKRSVQHIVEKTKTTPKIPHYTF